MLAVILVSLGAVACGGGPSPESLALAKKPVAKVKARIEIRRKNTLLYAGAPATIHVKGKKVASLGVGGTHIMDIKPGKTTISADAWSYPGKFTISLTPKPGGHYILEVSPREASFAPGALLGPIGGMIDASVNENADAFQIRPVGKGKKQAALDVVDQSPNLFKVQNHYG